MYITFLISGFLSKLYNILFSSFSFWISSFLAFRSSEGNLLIKHSSELLITLISFSVLRFSLSLILIFKFLMPSFISSIRESSIELLSEILSKSLWLFSDSLSDSESSDLISRLSSNLLSLSISKSLIKLITVFYIVVEYSLSWNRKIFHDYVLEYFQILLQ